MFLGLILFGLNFREGDGVEEHFPFLPEDIQVARAPADGQLVYEVISEDESFEIGHFVFVFNDSVDDFFDEHIVVRDGVFFPQRGAFHRQRPRFQFVVDGLCQFAGEFHFLDRHVGADDSRHAGIVLGLVNDGGNAVDHFGEFLRTVGEQEGYLFGCGDPQPRVGGRGEQQRQ